MTQQLKAEGRFKARTVDHGVGTVGEHDLPQWVARFAAYVQEGLLLDADGRQVYDDNGRPKQGWNNLDDEYEIVGYLLLAYLNKKTGEPVFSNTFTNLQEALGWTPDPNDIFGSLQNLDLSKTDLQIVVRRDEYQGKEKWVVAFVNPADYAGSAVRELDASAIQKLNSTWGSAFRAKFGGARAAAPAPAPAAPAPSVPISHTSPAPAPVGGTAPAAPVAPPKPATSAPILAAGGVALPPKAGEGYSGGECDMETAWKALDARKGQANDEQVGVEWFRNIAESFNAKTEDQIAAVTGAQWAWLRDHGEVLPF